MNNNRIGKFIATLRKEKGLTQAELGEKLFVTDKAVSKWERGISLPDITLLTKLAEVLDTEIVNILDGKKETAKKINIEEEVEKITKELNENHRKKMKKIFICLIILLLFIVYLIVRNISFGIDVKTVEYAHTNRNINLGIPKTSFMMKNNDRSYSFKNLRNSSIVENEVKEYLKTLKYLTCNDTIYYYNEKDNFSIINYSIKNHVLYNTLSYEIVDNDYCYMKKIYEYQEKLGRLESYHTMNAIRPSKNYREGYLCVEFLDGGDTPGKIYEFKATLKLAYIKINDDNSIKEYILEKSSGNIEIKGNKLYYYRTKILKQADDINVPEVSTFNIKDAKLTLVDNYVSKYHQGDIILK